MAISKYFFYSVFVVFLMVSPFISNAEDASKFKKHALPYGISIEIPKHWYIIGKSETEQVLTNTESLTGQKQGNKDIIIAAVTPTEHNGVASASIGIAVTKGKYMENSKLAMSSQELAKFEKIACLDIQKTASLFGEGVNISDCQTHTGNVGNRKAFITNYYCNLTGISEIDVVPYPTYKIEITSTYSEFGKFLFESTLAHMRSSLVLP